MKRETGHYWVMYWDIHTVAYWEEGFGWAIPFEKEWLEDSFFFKIDERKIRMPDESLPASLDIKELAWKYAEEHVDDDANISIGQGYENAITYGFELATCLHAEKMELMGRIANQLEKMKLYGGGSHPDFYISQDLLDEWNKLNQE